MHGKSYLEQFSLNPEMEALFLDPNKLADVMTLEDSQLVMDALTGLYVNRDVLFLGDPLPPQIVDDASGRLDDMNEDYVMGGLTGEVLKQRLRSEGYRSNRDRKKIPRDASLDQTRGEAAVTVIADIEDQNNKLMMASNRVLDTAIIANTRKLRTKGLSNPSDERYMETAKRATVQTMQSARPVAANTLLEWVGAIDVHREYLNGRLIGSAQVKAVPGRGHAQKWFEATQSWDEVIYRALSKGFEFDCYAALYEWVIDRRLPLVPVIAPRQIENGVKTDDKLKNPRADILLCSLADENLIPVQAKFTSIKRDEYIDEMRSLTPQIMGLETLSHGPVKVKGHIKTGDITTTHVGSLAHGFAIKHNTARRTQAPKQPEYRPRLERAFRAFDSVFSDDIALYKAA